MLFLGRIKKKLLFTSPLNDRPECVGVSQHISESSYILAEIKSQIEYDTTTFDNVLFDTKEKNRNF